ncbi:MAG: hypothetical protein EOM37_15945 [Proteobacteria bacterium]|nr:hypothetical protein [Pseudomonadota bacterium]
MDDTSNSLGRKIIYGGMVIASAQVLIRALGIVSALTVPRWLGPEEMGIFAVSMLVIAAIDAFTESGLVSAFLQRKSDYGKYIVPVRTFNALRGIFLGFLIYFSAPYVAHLMSAPRSMGVLKVLALAPVINGFMPMIWQLALKNFQFGYQAKYHAFMAFLNIGITVSLAWYLKNVWALVLGMLVSSLIGVVISTLMSREGRGFTLNLKPLEDLHSFGFWIFLTSIVSYLFTNGGNWLVGSLLSVQILAVYTLALKFSTMFTGEAASIINQMMLPVFSHIQDDLPRLRTGFQKSFGILAMIVVGVGVFFCVTAQDYFTIVLSAKWASYTTLFNSLLPWMTMWGISSALAGAQSGVFQALGKPHWWLWSILAMCAIMLLLIWPAIRLFGAVGAAAVLGGVAALMQIVRYIALARMIQIAFIKIISHVIGPVAAGILAVVAATWARGAMVDNVWGQAVLANSVVVCVYLLGLVLCAPIMEPNLLSLARQLWLYAKKRTPGVLT